MTFLISSFTGCVKSPTVPWKHQRTNPPLENIVKKSNISSLRTTRSSFSLIWSYSFDQQRDVNTSSPNRINNEFYDQIYRRLSSNHMVDKFSELVFWDFWNLFKTVKLSISWSNGIRILILFCRARNYKTLLNISAKFFQMKILIEKKIIYHQE